MDGETAQVGPRIAENLGLPQVTHAGELRVEGDRLVVKRRFEDRHHIIEVKPPCLITVLPELAEPRYMHVGGIVDAYRKEVRTFGFDDFKDGPDADSVGPGSPTSIVNYFTKRAKGAGELLRDVNANEAVAAIVRKMEERRLI
jgi:electron transfer flavoprotein beta subunit